MNIEFRKRSIARLYACQGVYLKIMLPHASEDDVWEACCEENEENFDVNLFNGLMEKWTQSKSDIQALMSEYLPKHWNLQTFDILLSSIIQTGMGELEIEKGQEAGLIITEYVDVGHAFFHDTETKIIHGILHNIAQKISAEHQDQA